MNFTKFHLPYRDDLAFGFLSLIFLLVPLAFSQFQYENFETIKFCILLIALGFSGAIYFFKTQNNLQTFKSHKIFFIALLIFFSWAIFSSFFAIDKLYAVIGFYYRFTSGLLFYAAWSLLIFLLSQMLNQEKRLYLLKILTVGAFLIALICILQSFGLIFYAGLENPGIFRGPSLLGNINYSAMYLVCLLPLMIFLTVKAKNFSAKIFYFTTALISLLAIFFLASRGALIALIICAIIFPFFIFKISKKFFFTALGFIFLSLFLGLILLNISRINAFSSILKSADSNTITRVAAWQISYRNILKHQFLGVGPGNFALMYEQDLSRSSNENIGVFDDAHNLFLHLATTGGLPLAIIFFSIIFFALFIAYKKFRQKTEWIYLALFLSLLAWIISTSFNPVPIPMYVLLALLLASVFLDDFVEYKKTNFKILNKAGIFFSGLFIILGLLLTVSESLLFFSNLNYNEGNFKSAESFSQFAIVINPTNPLNYVFNSYSKVKLNAPRPQLISLVERMKNLHPKQAASFASASNIYYARYFKTHDRQDLKDAAINMQESLKIDPYFASRLGILSTYYFASGDLAQTKQTILKAMAINNQDFYSWLLLSRLYQLENNRPATLAALKQAFKLNPTFLQLKLLISLLKQNPDVSKVPIQLYTREPSP